MLDELAEELPVELYKNLNGGIILLPKALESQYSQDGDLYTLGMYHSGGPMGNYISIYYGSFVQLFSHLSPESLKVKLRSVLRHEFRHHMETMSGEKGLVREDEKFINDYLSNKK